MLFCDRDVAPVFGHLSPLAGLGTPTGRSLLVILAALAFPAAASAHATLRATTPHPGHRGKVTALREVRLHFDQHT